MKRKPTIEQLCTACHNEDSHAEHVTRLALTIFDGIRRPFGLPASDRRLLTAVGRLHDIGYRSHPANHANAAAAIIETLQETS